MWLGSPDWPSSQRTDLLPMSAAHVLNNCNDKLATAKLGPNSIDATAQRVLEQEYGEMCFCRIIYEPRRDQIPMSDAEFSRPSIADRRAAGYSDMMSSLRQKPWLSPVGEAAESVDRGAVAPVGAFVYECRRGRISRRVLDARPAIQGPRERSVIGPLLQGHSKV